VVPQGFEHASGKPEAALGRLVSVGGRADRGLLAAPGRPSQLATQHLHNVGLDHDAGLEVHARVPVLGDGVVRAGVAVDAGVDAPDIRVQRPFEGHALDAVERRLAADLDVLDASHKVILELMFSSVNSSGCASATRP
jgi:hypothetical protein